MKYFLDTEFLEGTQKKWFGETKPTIDLISIGLVEEDGREYYAISKDFNIKEAWNRYDLVKDGFRDMGLTPNYKKVYWLRDNVLKSIWEELTNRFALEEYKANVISCTVGYNPPMKFTYKNFKNLIKKYGKTNNQIAKEVKHFVANRPIEANKEQWILDYDTKDVSFYGYYADYDWVVFCWLFGKMIDLPKGFPMFAFDIQQQIEEYKINKEQLLKEVPQINCHNSLHDAIWNKDAYNWIQKKIK